MREKARKEMFLQIESKNELLQKYSLSLECMTIDEPDDEIMNLLLN